MTLTPNGIVSNTDSLHHAAVKAQQKQYGPPHPFSKVETSSDAIRSVLEDCSRSVAIFIPRGHGDQLSSSCPRSLEQVVILDWGSPTVIRNSSFLSRGEVVGAWAVVAVHFQYALVNQFLAMLER